MGPTGFLILGASLAILAIPEARKKVGWQIPAFFAVMCIAVLAGWTGGPE